MEIKGTVMKCGPIEERTYKEKPGTYTICHVEVQVGKHTRWNVNQTTGVSFQEEVPDVVAREYFHEEARTAAEMLRVGMDVMVDFYTFINKYGKNELRVERINACGATYVPNAQGQMQAANPYGAPMSPESRAAAGYMQANAMAAQNGATYQQAPMGQMYGQDQKPF